MFSNGMEGREDAFLMSVLRMTLLFMGQTWTSLETLGMCSSILSRKGRFQYSQALC